MATNLEIAHFDQIARRSEQLRQQLARVIIGQEQTIQTLIAALFCQGHVLIIGVPGLAKTLMVRTLAQALNLSYGRIQFTPDMMPSDILGTQLIQQDAQSGKRHMTFVPGPIFAQLILADEINRTPPKTQAALLEAMAEYQITTAGRTIPLQQPFVVMATQNPIEQQGTYPLPLAQLDRFMFSLWMDYPDQQQEFDIVRQTPDIPQKNIEPVCNGHELIEFGQMIRQMPISRHVVAFAVSLVRATRPLNTTPINESKDNARPENIPHPMARRYVQWGAGPRAGQFLILAAKTLAAMQAKPTPDCQDVRDAASSVLRHRVLINDVATRDGITPQHVIHQMIQQTSEPIYQ